MRGRGSSGFWHDGGLKYRCTRPSVLVQHNFRRELQVYGRVGEGREKCVPKPAEEERGARGGQG